MNESTGMGLLFWEVATYKPRRRRHTWQRVAVAFVLTLAIVVVGYIVEGWL